jgi:hypothetical protein
MKIIISGLKSKTVISYFLNIGLGRLIEIINNSFICPGFNPGIK